MKISVNIWWGLEIHPFFSNQEENDNKTVAPAIKKNIIFQRNIFYSQMHTEQDIILPLSLDLKIGEIDI